MFTKFALVITGLMLTVSSVGCCCMGYGYGAGYRNGCAPCNNGCSPAGGGYQVAPMGYTTQGAQVFQGDMSQTAYSPNGFSQSAFVTPSQSAYISTPQTALAPIQGPPIYNTAVVNSLPTY